MYCRLSISSRILFTLLAASLTSRQLPAQTQDAFSWASQAITGYRVLPNTTYQTASNWDAKLDLYLPRNAAEPVPTLVYIHGGGWVGGSKDADVLFFLPYIQMGWAVVNVEYRLARVALAPAAVEDCRCALRWVFKNAKEYKFDTTKIVVTGGSAGGHLSLMTGMLTSEAGLDRQCAASGEVNVAAIINWYGITDVVDLLDGPDMKSYAVLWMGSMTNREDIAKRVSPLTYVRKGLPPILTIHGDADPIVPYAHAVRLRDALDKAGVPNKLLTIPGGKHGGFTPEEMKNIYASIREFLAEQGIWNASR